MPVDCEKRVGLWWRNIMPCVWCLTLVISGCKTKKHHVDLSWNAPKNSPVEIVGYNVYRSTVENSYYHRLNSSPVKNTTFEDDLAQSGRTYVYVVRSVSASGVESAPSNAARVTIP
jgi:fibronectin type 3 domain-containing protein